MKYLEQTSDFFIKSYQVVYYSFQYASHTRTLWGSCIFNLHNLQIVENKELKCFNNEEKHDRCCGKNWYITFYYI